MKGGEKKYKSDPIVERAKKLKLRSGCTNAVSSTTDIERVANYAKIKILLFNEKEECKNIYDGGDKETIKLIFYKNHCYSLIPFKEEIDFRLLQPQTQVRCLKGDKNRDLDFYAADLEAVTDSEGLSVAYAIAYGYYSKNDTVYRSFKGIDICIPEFFEELFNDGKNKTVYFHNGGKYDINVIIQNFLLDSAVYTIDNKQKVYLNGRYARFVVLKGKVKVTFLDSMCLFNMSLDRCTGKKGFDVEHKKLSGAINHKLVTVDNYNEVMEKGQLQPDGEYGISGDTYLKHDVIGLLECLDKFGKDVWEDYEINITKVISAASISKRIFKQNFIQKERPIHLLDEQEDSFIRDSYHGGRTESFFKGVYTTGDQKYDNVSCRKGKCYYYDFTSLYPSVAAVGDCGMPYGPCHPVNTGTSGLFKKGRLIETQEHIKFLEEKAVFLKVEVQTVDFNRRPLHCLQADKSGRLVFPHFKEWTPIHLTGVEILRGLTEGIYRYKTIEGYWFKKSPILQDYFMSLTDKKKEATAAGLESKALCLKIIANSGYGFWALRTEQRPDVDILEADDLDGFLARVLNEFDDVYEAGNKLVISFKKDIVGSEKNIAIGSYITSLARLKIWNLIDAIERKGEKVLYCDTDSVITTIHLEDHIDLMKEFMWDGCGKDLGALKNEIADAVAKDCKKSEIPVVKDHNWMDLVFFAGLKCYSYVCNYAEGRSITDSKLKGYKQHGDFTEESDNVRTLNEDDYIKLLSGESLTQRVAQFSSNKRGKYQQWQKISSIEKKFNFTYNKGKVQPNGDILPFNLPEDSELIGEMEGDPEE
jgi:hypothetical protein